MVGAKRLNSLTQLESTWLGLGLGLGLRLRLGLGSGLGLGLAREDRERRDDERGPEQAALEAQVREEGDHLLRLRVRASVRANVRARVRARARATVQRAPLWTKRVRQGEVAEAQRRREAHELGEVLHAVPG